MVRMLNLGKNTPKLPKKEEQKQDLVDVLTKGTGGFVDAPVNNLPKFEVTDKEDEGVVEPLSRVIDEKLGKPVTTTSPVKEKPKEPKAVANTEEEELPTAKRAGGISLVGIIQSNVDSVTVYTRKVYVPASRVVGYLLRNDGVEELEVFADVLVEQERPRLMYQPNTSLLTTAKDPSTVAKVPFAIGETRAFTKAGLIALNETCKEIGSTIGLGNALSFVVNQMRDLHPELTEGLATEIAKDFTFKIEVKAARGEGILVPDNPEGLFSKLSVALGLRTHAKTVKMDIARKLIEHDLVGGKSPEEVLLMMKDRLNITLPQGLLLPVPLFDETYEENGVSIAAKGSKVKPEFEEVFGVYNQFNNSTPKKSVEVTKSDKPKKSPKPKVKEEPKPTVSSQVDLANYFAHYLEK